MNSFTAHPVISVCIFNFNYADFLEQAIVSVLGQRLDVPFEIVIGDDCSTDRSSEIIRSFCDKSAIVRPIFNSSNLGGTGNWVNTIMQCRGKYIALLDGDDYFLDPLKLQKQFNMLHADPACNLSFHGVKEVYSEHGKVEEKDVLFEKPFYSGSEVFKRGWFIRTSSFFFRKEALPDELPGWIYEYPYRLDSILPVLLTRNGYAGYISDVMSVWRRHSGGMSNVLRSDFVTDALTRIRLAEVLNVYLNNKYEVETDVVRSRLYSEIFLHLLRSRSLDANGGLFLESLKKMDFIETLSMIGKRVLSVKAT